MLSCHLNRICVNKKKVMGLRVSHCIGRKVHTVWQVQCSWRIFYIQCELHKCPNSPCTDKSCRKYLIFGFRSKRDSYCTVRDYVCLDCSSHFQCQQNNIFLCMKTESLRCLSLHLHGPMTHAVFQEQANFQSLITVS